MDSADPSQAELDAMGMLLRASADPPPAGGCPDAGHLATFAEGRTPAAERPELERHVARCPTCRRVVAELVDTGAPVEPDLQLTREAPTEATSVTVSPSTDPTQFGPYQILRRIGSGGMGVVYEVVHSQRGRREALKVLKAGASQVPDLVERFLLEMKTLSSIEHDHIVRLYDSGRVGDELYFTMPLMLGAPLSEIIREVRGTGETSPGALANEVLDRHHIPRVDCGNARPEVVYARRVAAALAGVADALAKIHARNIVHRDVKPLNLMLDADGRVLLADFGLVRTGDVHITKTGTALGTAAYMSPEQVLAGHEKPDGRADIYALGATLFEMLTLHLPHEGANTIDVLCRKLNDRVRPLREFNPALQLDVEVIVSRCLEFRREDRYPDADRLSEDLAAFARGEAVMTRALSRARRLRHYLVKHRRPIGIATATFAFLCTWLVTRQASLTISSVPPAHLSIDTTPSGMTPIWGLSVDPGKHWIRLEHPNYEPYLREETFSRGESLKLDKLLLQPLDPADPQAIRAVLDACGLKLSTVDLKTGRSAGEVPAIVAQSPRGAMMDAPKAIHLWADDVAEGLHVRLIAKDSKADAEPLATWATGAIYKQEVLPVAPEVTTVLVPGREYIVDVMDASGKLVSSSAFHLAETAEAQCMTAELATLKKRFDVDDSMADIAATEYLLGHGYFAEALNHARALEKRLGTRSEIARMGLAALDRAGLRETGPWAVWAKTLTDESK